MSLHGDQDKWRLLYNAYKRISPLTEAFQRLVIHGNLRDRINLSEVTL